MSKAKVSHKDRREARLEFHRSCEIVSSEQFKKALAAVKAKISKKTGHYHPAVRYAARASAIILGLLTFCSCTPAVAGPIRDADAVRAIIGEAGGEGRAGMLAVACAIRNRGTLTGVYGLNARQVDHQPEYVWRAARGAWTASASRDITCGATHWENVSAFGVPAWARSMTVTTNIGHHVFFKK